MPDPALGWVKYLPRIQPYSVDQVIRLLDEIECSLDTKKHTPLVEQQLQEYRKRLVWDNLFSLTAGWMIY